MNPAFALNLFSKVGFGEQADRAGTPGTIGENLFKKFLTKENGLASSGEKASKIRQGHSGKDREPLENAISMSDFPLNRLRFEPGVKGKLEAFLQGRGLTSKDSADLIEGATDGDGFIRLDRLMRGLAALKGVNAKEQMDLFISATDVPKFQEVLFNMGLGAGEIKALVEKGNDGEGNLVFGKIFPDLSRSFPEIDSQKTLVRLLSRFGIQSENKEIIPSIKPGELQTFLNKYAATPSEDVQKNIKARLADLLREKGVPPQKVKSFLEGMNVEYAEKASRVAASKEGKPTTGAEIGLWNGIVLKPQSPGQKDPWTEKILAILKGSGNGIRKGGEGEGPSSRSMLSELLEKEGGGSKSLAEKAFSIVDAEETARTGKGSRWILKSKGGDDQQPFATGNSPPGFSDQNASLEKLHHAGKSTGNFGRLFNPSQETSTISNLLDRMQWMVEAGRQKARIRLSPPELGQIDLRLVIDQGHLHAHLGTDNPLVKEMIESNLGQLRQQLSDLGFVVEEFSVHVGQDQREFGEDLWERSSPMVGVGGNGKQGIEPLSQASATLRALADDRYQINVRV